MQSVDEKQAPTRARRAWVRAARQSGKLWVQPLWVHAGALALLLLVVLPFMTPRGSFTADEGAYALQERALAEGSWEYDYRAAGVDPEGRYFPLDRAEERHGRFYPYVKHPAYPIVLRGATAVLGVTFGLTSSGSSVSSVPQ